MLNSVLKASRVLAHLILMKNPGSVLRLFQPIVYFASTMHRDLPKMTRGSCGAGLQSQQSDFRAESRKNAFTPCPLPCHPRPSTPHVRSSRIRQRSNFSLALTALKTHLELLLFFHLTSAVRLVSGTARLTIHSCFSQC